MYAKYSDEELIEAYTSMMNYSGEVNKEMLNEIESRGGLEKFKQKIEKQKILTGERNRISKEVYSLTSSETNAEFIKPLITSDILTKDQLSDLIETRFLYYQSINKDRIVSSKTIVGSIAGVVLGAILGGLFLFFVSRQLGEFVYWLLIPAYLLNYFIIWLITKQTRANWVIFIASLFATVGSILVSLYVLGVF